MKALCNFEDIGGCLLYVPTGNLVKFGCMANPGQADRGCSVGVRFLSGRWHYVKPADLEPWPCSMCAHKTLGAWDEEGFDLRDDFEGSLKIAIESGDKRREEHWRRWIAEKDWQDWCRLMNNTCEAIKRKQGGLCKLAEPKGETDKKKEVMQND